jgi:hypothetical protein
VVADVRRVIRRGEKVVHASVRAVCDERRYAAEKILYFAASTINVVMGCEVID